MTWYSFLDTSTWTSTHKVVSMSIPLLTIYLYRMSIAVPKLLVVGGNGFLGELTAFSRISSADEQVRRSVKLPSPRGGRCPVSGKS